LTASYGTYCNAKLSPCPVGDNIGALVRLAFHDAAGNGGANGCIDFVHTTSNNGLQAVVTALNQMYYANSLDKIISKADLYVLAANTAIAYATTEPAQTRPPPPPPPPRQGPRLLTEATNTETEQISADVHSEAFKLPPRTPTFKTLTPQSLPTRLPSAAPKVAPSRAPTAAATQRPTVAPVAQPSRAPAAVPTQRPSTAQPTRDPTSASPTTLPGSPTGGNNPPPPPLDPLPYTLALPFRYGRVDAVSCDDSDALPGADFTWHQVNGLFGGRMGMSIKEVVAILGAHSLGRCEYANSGFDGGWTSSQSSFSNSYYKTFGDSTWNNNNHSDIWTSQKQQTILLMADVELLFVTNTNGEGTCQRFNTIGTAAAPPQQPHCPLQAQSYGTFLSYAANINYFFGNFSSAWQKMTEFLESSDAELVSVGAAQAASYPQVDGTTGSPSLAPSIVVAVSNQHVGIGLSFGVGALVFGSGMFYFAKKQRTMVAPSEGAAEKEVEMDITEAEVVAATTVKPMPYTVEV
jgi:hypothetical protein